jgi:hypothetical protein
MTFYSISSDKGNLSWFGLNRFPAFVIVGLTGYVHIMREGGKPVVLLLDD